MGSAAFALPLQGRLQFSHFYIGAFCPNNKLQGELLAKNQ